MPRAFLLLILILLQSPQSAGQDPPSPPQQKPDDVVLRDNAVPYVKDGSIYILPGEKFGVNAQVDGDKIASLSYVKDTGKADIQLEFTKKGGGNGVMMLLVIHNKLKQTLYLDAGMQVPDRKGAYKTSILPVVGGKAGFESWPHPISLLILRNLRFTK